MTGFKVPNFQPAALRTSLARRHEPWHHASQSFCKNSTLSSRPTPPASNSVPSLGTYQHLESSEWVRSLHEPIDRWPLDAACFTAALTGGETIYKYGRCPNKYAGEERDCQRRSTSSECLHLYQDGLLARQPSTGSGLKQDTDSGQCTSLCVRPMKASKRGARGMSLKRPRMACSSTLGMAGVVALKPREIYRCDREKPTQGYVES